MSWCGSVWVHLIWDPLFLLYLNIFLFLKLGKLFAMISLNTFSAPCFFSYPSRDPHNVNVDMLDVIPKISSTVFLYFYLLSDWL